MSWFVLKEGVIDRSEGIIKNASSSVVFSDYDINCVIDTGTSSDSERIVSELNKLGYGTRDIDLVINTHLHHDHIGCNDLFDRAKKITSPVVAEKRNDFEGGLGYLTDYLEIFETPGHTRNHVSVKIKGDKDIVVAGDAIPEKENYLGKKPPGINFDREVSLNSIKKIANKADVIIPGHDKAFEVKSSVASSST